MGQTIGTRTFQFPDKGERVWYPKFVTLAQNITDYLDLIAQATELAGDATPQLGGDLDLNGNNTIVDANGNEMIVFSPTASAVNEVTITNNVAGSAPSISATGTDTNIDITLAAKGTGKITTSAGLKLGADLVVDDSVIYDTNGNESISFATTASAVNHVKFTNQASGDGPTVGAVGDDTDVDLQIQAAGTGKVQITDGMTLNTDLVFASDNTYTLGDSTNYFSTIYTTALTFDKETTSFAEQALCKVLLNYDHTTPSIVDSLNVSSVTDHATGLFTINFSITMDGAENLWCTCAGTTQASSSIRDCRMEYFARPGTTTTMKFAVCDHNATTAGVEVDAAEVYVGIWGGYG